MVDDKAGRSAGVLVAMDGKSTINFRYCLFYHHQLLVTQWKSYVLIGEL